MKNREIKSDQESTSGLKKWLPLFVMGLAIVIIVLDTTLLNVSLGTIVRELNTDIQSLQWVITAYSLTLAAFTITGGRLGDLFGRKKMFIIGAAIFAAGSFIASISHSVGYLLIGESIVEGVGAALMMPATSSLLVSNYRGKDRAIALGVWGGMAAAGSALGPILGGYLTSHYSWRWGFRINVLVAAILIAGSVIIKEARDKEEKPTVDYMGVLLSSTGLLLGVFAIIESSKYGWLMAKEPLTFGGTTLSLGGYSVVPFALIASFILLFMFVLWENRMTSVGSTPLVSMKLFRNQQFTSGAMTTGLLSLGQVGLIFGLPVYLQGVRGLDAFHTGLAMLPLSVMLLIFAPLGGFLGSKFVPKRIVQTGLVIDIVALLLMRSMLGPDISLALLAFPIGLYGAGIGLGMSQLSNITLSSVAVDEAGEVSGVNNTVRQLGSSLGSAIIGSILIATLTSTLLVSIQKSPDLPSDKRQVISEQIVAQASAVEFGAAARTSVPLSSSEQGVIRTIVTESTVKANKLALLCTAIFTMLAFIASTKLPNIRNVERNESLAGSAH